MKKMHYTVLAAALGLALAGSAAAEAPAGRLDVRGTIEVPGCTVAIAGDGGDTSSEYNFGDIDPSNVKPGDVTTKLPALTKTWTISCDGLTNLTFQIDDREKDSTSGTANTTFGLGKVNDDGKIGYYEVKLSKPMTGVGTADPVVSKLFTTTGTTFTAVDTISLDSRNKMGWAASNNNLAAAQIFIADVEVTPTLAGTTTMKGTITEDIQLDGALTFNFAFGL